eukprot:Gregarina_sp_Poly_1__5761@NODE_302_length_9747_cov_161_916736_g261_i0_p3_GENE_NODE_302_length_9747_cov_161_916736_g261_i0NODE_302_length_9747_cov_161_916736_g261_i0_p3_ORF_typecomplete_len488_score43_65Hydrolase_4/PF12146_8/6e27Abhydrolase_6/PF12697_7/4_2e03Abhydrolase_6/PF12697_7/5_4e07Abhydrolase_1/PF00561_20/8_9e03Abhydrolase_1/PF00561_20/2_4e05DUF1100/PF06500_11/3_6e02DUF1100/PF06500_11/0_0013Peptidase_S15/PF02129_18/0_0035Abhydrolase_5/PF12695_7/0_0096Abhydrolase_5/PF12695_7/1e04Abhydrolase
MVLQTCGITQNRVRANLIFLRAAMQYNFDGAPSIQCFKSPQNLDIYYYLWTPSGSRPRALVALFHGVRAHTRLTWLAKRHPCLDGASPYSVHNYVGHWLCPLHTQTADNICHRRSSIPPAGGDHNLSDDELTADLEDWHSSDRSTCVCSEEFGEVCSLHFPEIDAGSASDLEGISDHDRSTNVFYRGSWVEGFVNNGMAVYGMDLQGHGLSQGYARRRCFVRNYDDFKDDAIWFLKSQVREQFPSTPLFLAGVSMSGQVVMRIAQDPSAANLNISGIVCMAGMLAVGPAFSKHPMKAVLKANCDVLAKIAPTLPIGKYRSDDAPHWQRSVGDRDPLLYKGSFTAKMIAESVAGIDCVRLHMKYAARSGACQHLLFLHNRSDPVCVCTGTIQAYQTIASELRNNQLNPKALKSMTCIIFNADQSKAELTNLEEQKIAWNDNCGHCRTKFILDSTPLQVHHTLANDLDHAYVFGRLLAWIESCLPKRRS